MPQPLNDKVAIVTGGASGIGEAIARAYVMAGANVIIADLPGSNGASLARELGASAKFADLDVRSEEQWLEVVRQTEASYGPVSVLVNNAGIINWNTPIETQAEREFRDVIDVNLIGCFLGTKSVIASMQKVGFGSVINMASTAALVGYPTIAAYVASKWAVRGFTKASAIELGAYNIRANCICPGGVRTKMIEDIAQPRSVLNRTADAAEIGGLAIYLASDDSSFATGGEFVIDGGHTAGIY